MARANTDNSSPEGERDEIKALMRAEMKVDQDWYLIEFKWWQMWQQYVNYEEDSSVPPSSDSARPGPIDNSPILEDPLNQYSLKQELQENYDYVLVPKIAHRKLKNWYGGGPEICRTSVATKTRSCRVDLYPLHLTWQKAASSGTNIPPKEEEIYLSRDSSVKRAKFELGSKVGMPPHKIRLWNIPDTDDESASLLEEDGRTLDELGVEDGNGILVEVMLNDGLFPRDRPDDMKSLGSYHSSTSSHTTHYNPPPVGTVTYSEKTGVGANSHSSHAGVSSVGNSYGRSNTDYYKNTEGKPIGAGLCGLVNLGNTCFMNSALQCLSNTTLLTNYFLSGEYKEDINRTNVLGMKGLLADFYSILMTEIWSSKYRAVAPTSFKKMLGRFAPQFSGFQQHDSQELLAFLLDGLHEDLNRVVVKPYVESVESGGRPDAIVADEAWEAHLKRNKSVIVDLFQGQFKSTVICPVCSRVSITFDPFMYLSVPLPVTNERVLKVTCIYRERTPLRYAIKVPKNGVVIDIKKSLTTVVGLGVEQMGICDIYCHKIFKILPENYSIKNIRDNDEIFCFEIVANDDKLTGEKLQKRLEQKFHERQVRKQQRAELRAAKVKAKEAAGETMDTDEETKPVAVTTAEPMETEDIKTVATEGDKDEEKQDSNVKEDKGKEKENEEEDDNKDGNDESSDEEGYAKPPKPWRKFTYHYPSVIHRQLKTNPMRKGRKYETFAYPFVLSIDTSFMTNRQLYDTVWYHVQRIYKQDGPEPVPENDEEKDARLEKAASQVDNLSEEELRGLKGAGDYPFTMFLSVSSGYGNSTVTEIPLNDEFHGEQPPAYKVNIVLDWTDDGIAKYIKTKIENDVSIELLKKEAEEAVPLSDCLRLFTKQEKLSADDAWYCSSCGEHREASKKFDLWKLPKVLVVHLKRFQFTRMWRDKLDTLVEFPLELDLSSYTQGSSEVHPLYNLVGVSNHSGNMGFGHYTAYCKNRIDGKWYCFNDSSVSEASVDDIVTSSAYLLFYERQDVKDNKPIDFEYNASETEQILKQAQAEIDKEEAKEREKNRAKAGYKSGSLDDIDIGRPAYGPHLPGDYSGISSQGQAGDPMDTEVTSDHRRAGYDQDEEEGEEGPGASGGLRNRSAVAGFSEDDHINSRMNNYSHANAGANAYIANANAGVQVNNVAPKAGWDAVLPTSAAAGASQIGPVAGGVYRSVARASPTANANPEPEPDADSDANSNTHTKLE